MFGQMGSVPKEERARVGKAMNEVKILASEKFEKAKTSRVVEKSPIPPPVGFNKTYSPAEVSSESKRLNSQVAVTKMSRTRVRILLCHSRGW